MPSMPVRVCLNLPVGPGNAGNRPGSFVELRDGRLLMAYSHFDNDQGTDHTSAFLAGRYSSDAGETWTPTDVVLLPNEGEINVGGASLRRMSNGDLGLCYRRKDGLAVCHDFLRRSTDEGETWSSPVCCTPEPGYFVVNNDRLLQLRSGRWILPASWVPRLRWVENRGFTPQFVVRCYLSDDDGATWRRSRTTLRLSRDGDGLQEPGVVELREEGRVMLWARTARGCQYRSWSEDGGETWSPPKPSDLLSPVSPASCKRIPTTGDLLLIWNDHSARRPPDNRRTPLTAAISRNEGITWEHRQELESDPEGRFDYPAIQFAGDHVLVAYNCTTGDYRGLRVIRFPLAWLYE